MDVSTIDTDSNDTISASEVLTHLQSQGVDTVDLYTTPQNMSDATVRHNDINLTPLSATDIVDLTAQDTYYFSVRDSSGAKVTPNYLGRIQVTGSLNTAPTITADSYTGIAGQPITGNLLTNDSDADGDTLSVPGAPLILATSAGGSITVQSDGSFVYTGPIGYTGTDTVDVPVTDGTVAVSNSVNFTLTNTAPNTTTDTYSEVAGNTISGNVLTNDTDAEGHSLTASIENPTAQGSVNLQSDGTFIYTPPSGFSGSTSFTYIANDGYADSMVTTVNLSYTNTAPTAMFINLSGTETSVININLATYTNDADGHSLTYAITNTPAGAPSISINGNMATLTMPATAVNTLYSYTYQVSDAFGGSNTENINITNQNVNNPQGGADLIEVAPNATQTGNLLSNDSNIINILSYTTPEEGSLSLNTSTGDYSYIASSNEGNYSFTYIGENEFGEQTNAILVSIAVDNTFSIQDLNFSKDVMIYPNPVLTHFKVWYQGNVIQEDLLNLQWFDATGRKVSQGTSINQLPSGVYFLKIKYEGKTAVKKIVKK